MQDGGDVLGVLEGPAAHETGKSRLDSESSRFCLLQGGSERSERFTGAHLQLLALGEP